MWTFILTVTLLCSSSVWCQRSPRQDDDPNNWDIRLAVPGEPGNDYPTLGGIPRTGFSCAGKTPGYYADTEANCQVFRVCTLGSTYGFQSFLCPNGTLFNQAVFVCDWWMNVNCASSSNFITNNNQKFSNLKIGPKFMSDIKKMISHPMKNPYDKSSMKSNLIVMQEYKPPSGQLSPPVSAKQLTGPKNAPQTAYVPAKLQQQPNRNKISDNLVAGSTAGPRYALPQSNSNDPFQRQTQFTNAAQNGYDYSAKIIQGNQQSAQVAQSNGNAFQRQTQFSDSDQNGYSYNAKLIQGNQQSVQVPSRQYIQSNIQQNPQYNGQYQITQNSLIGTTASTIANGQAGRFMIGNMDYTNKYYGQSGQQQSNYQFTQQYNQNQNTNRQNVAQYTGSVVPLQQLNTPKQTSEFGISFSRQQINPNQDKQPYTYNAPNNIQYSSQVKGPVGTEVKQNLVSPNRPNNLVTKKVTVNRIVQPKPGGPKSRIVFKTWVTKPAKSARIILQPTPYTYERPSTPPNAKIIIEPTPYFYRKPTPSQKQVTDDGYSYERPQQQVTEQEGYQYERPTTPEKQVEIIRPTPRPFATAPTIISTTPPRLYLAPLTSPTPPPTRYIPPSQPPKLFLAPTTFKPLVNLYLPPSPRPSPISEPSRQYLVSNDDEQSAKLQASPTSSTPVFAPAPSDKPSLFSLIKHSRVNTNHNNLTFTDILTREKLDITVNDIVKDTSKILGTASAPQFGQLRQGVVADDYPDENYLPPQNAAVQNAHESGETITPSPSTSGALKSAKLIAKPAFNLVPPEDSSEHDVQSGNRISNLPFIQQPTVTPTNTIERTVSLKISIPEKTAAYLFKTCNDSDFDKLEILNTGSSNYLVLTNKINQNPIPSFIPIGKLILDKDSNLSDSQALVFSFLADSLNQVKGYNTLAEQNQIQHPTSQTQHEHINSEEIAQISNQVAQLTSAQFSNNNQGNRPNANIQTNQNNGNQFQTSAKYTSGTSNNQQQYNAQINSAPQPNYYTAKYPTVNNAQYNNENQIYSGQLYQIPVPDVTGIYNGQSSAKLISPTIVEQHLEVADLQQNHQQSNQPTQSSGEVEIIQSQSVPLPQGGAPARLQAAPTEETLLNSHEDHTSSISNFINNGNGITAQIQDKIVGTINHPSQDNKLVSYKKDQSYFVYTTLDNLKQQAATLDNLKQQAATLENLKQQVNTLENLKQQQQAQDNRARVVSNQQSARLTQGSSNNNNNQGSVVFQFIPSVGYQLDDEKEQQKFLKVFNIDEFGSPKAGLNNGNNQGGSNILTSNIDYTVQHGQGQAQSQQYNNAPNQLYAGPSSYSAPQASVGQLGNLVNAAKIEQFDEKTGYSKNAPSRSFAF